MREDIKECLEYLELVEDADIFYRVSLIRDYIIELNSKIEKMQLRTEMLEIISLHLFRKEVFKDEKS